MASSSPISPANEAVLLMLRALQPEEHRAWVFAGTIEDEAGFAQHTDRCCEMRIRLRAHRMRRTVREDPGDEGVDRFRHIAVTTELLQDRVADLHFFKCFGRL